MILSANKSNCLFWLGRYVERGYLLLHLMRRAYDEVLDLPAGLIPESDLLRLLHFSQGETFTTSREMMRHLYDSANPASLKSIIGKMMDNAILLRPEIYTESFSYIELCHNLINYYSESNDDNITDLQPITDYLLAFWGSVLERVHGRKRNLLMIGKYVEQLDMDARYDYKLYRLKEVWGQLSYYFKNDADLFDMEQVELVDELLQNEEEYMQHNMGYKSTLLKAIGLMVKV